VLLDEGVDVNSRSGPGETALITACKSGRIEVVKALLDAGANVDATSLVEYEGNFRVKNFANETVLGAAILSGHREVVDALLRSRADVTAPSAGSAVAIRKNVNSGSDYVVTQKDKVPGTPLALAVQSGNVGTVKALLVAGADIDVVTLHFVDLHRRFIAAEFSWTAITLAEALKRHEILAVLKNAEAKVA
jgi:ankyrin repeat protein